jgi:hypothetical protein
MTKVAAGITISLDGYITGHGDGPGRGLGEGGERLHYWVFGGPWSVRDLQQQEVGGRRPDADAGQDGPRGGELLDSVGSLPGQGGQGGQGGAGQAVIPTTLP